MSAPADSGPAGEAARLLLSRPDVLAEAIGGSPEALRGARVVLGAIARGKLARLADAAAERVAGRVAMPCSRDRVCGIAGCPLCSPMPDAAVHEAMRREIASAGGRADWASNAPLETPDEGETLGEYRGRFGWPGRHTGMARRIVWRGGRWAMRGDGEGDAGAGSPPGPAASPMPGGGGADALPVGEMAVVAGEE